MTVVLLAVCAAGQTASAQAGSLDAMGVGGYAFVLQESGPPHTALAGVAASVWLSDRWRLGLEYLEADLFPDFEDRDTRARLVAPVVEYQFRPSGKFRPYVVVGFGYLLWRTFEANLNVRIDPTLERYHWREESSITLGGGCGIRIPLTKRLFIAPEVRPGINPFLRTTVAVGYTVF